MWETVSQLGFEAPRTGWSMSAYPQVRGLGWGGSGMSPAASLICMQSVLPCWPTDPRPRHLRFPRGTPAAASQAPFRNFFAGIALNPPFPLPWPWVWREQRKSPTWTCCPLKRCRCQQGLGRHKGSCNQPQLLGICARHTHVTKRLW